MARKGLENRVDFEHMGDPTDFPLKSGSYPSKTFFSPRSITFSVTGTSPSSSSGALAAVLRRWWTASEVPGHWASEVRISLRAQRTMLRGLRKLYGGEVTLVVLAERRRDLPRLILKLWVRGNHLKRSRLRWFNLQYGSGCSWTSVPTKAGFSIFRSRSFPVSGGPGPDPPREEQAKNSACNRNA